MVSVADHWAAIEQALNAFGEGSVRHDEAMASASKALAAVGEAKRREQSLRDCLHRSKTSFEARESELDHEVNGPSGLREQLEAARKGEQIEFRMRQKAEARAAELERALTFYADKKNWTQPTSWGGRIFDEDGAAIDCGKTAREALGVRGEATEK